MMLRNCMHCFRMALTSGSNRYSVAAAEHGRASRLIRPLVRFPVAAEPAAMSTTRRKSTTISCSNCEPETFEKGLIRGAAVKYNDSRALRLRRRALLQVRHVARAVAVIRPHWHVPLGFRQGHTPDEAPAPPRHPSFSSPASRTTLQTVGAWLSKQGAHYQEAQEPGGLGQNA